MSVASQPNLVTSGLVMSLDANNPRSYSTNVFNNSLDSYAWGSGGGHQMTSARDASAGPSPAGGIPMKLVTSGTSAYLGTYNSSQFNLASAIQGQTWTVSFYIKASTAVTASMLIFEANSSGNYLTYGQPYYNVTTEWTRVSGTYTFTNASAAYIQMRIDCYVSGVTLWVDGIQVEKTSSASTFNNLYNANGATWSDISGYQNHHSLIGAPNWASGKIALDGSTQGVSRLSSITGVTTTNTVVIWYSTTDTQELWVRGNQDNTYYLSASYGNPYYNSNCGSPTNYVDLALTTNPATPINYRDGIYHMWEAKNVDFVTVPWTAYEWWLYPSSWQMSGSVAAIMIYNRAITAAESAQNFAAYRGRYGV